MPKWEKIVALVFGTFAVVLTVWRVGEYFSLDKTTWSGWVQAIGSIGAIIGAYSVADRQHRNQVARDAETNKAKVRGVLMSLRAEMESFSQGFLADVKYYVWQKRDGSGNPQQRIPVPEKPFLIYEGNISSIGEIESHLRSKIVTTYGSAFDLLAIVKMINSLANEELRSYEPRSEKHSEVALMLRQQIDRLKKSHDVICPQVDDLLTWLPHE